MNNWTDLIFRMLVPLIFFGIWAVTALFNRESKGFVPRPPGQGDPTLRWGPTTPQTSPAARRTPLGDDDILIIPSDPRSSGRPTSTPRRLVKSRSVPQPKRQEPTSTMPKLGGVSQNVNQQLARPMDMTPLSSISPMATSTGSDLANSPSAPSKTSAVLTVSTLIPLMNNPTRLREAFIVNELLQRPLALRDRRGSRP
jgi:hypothetical protein